MIPDIIPWTAGITPGIAAKTGVATTLKNFYIELVEGKYFCNSFKPMPRDAIATHPPSNSIIETNAKTKTRHRLRPGQRPRQDHDQTKTKANTK